MEWFIQELCTILLLLIFDITCADRGRVYMVTSPESVKMPINDETILTCEMNLQPDRFQWRHYPLDIKKSLEPKTPILLSTAQYNELSPDMYISEKKTSTLRIKSSSNSIAGDYQCLAHYGASIVASVPGRITVTSLGDFPPQNTTQVTVSAGNTVAWRCEPPVSNPPSAIDYYRNGMYISPKISMPLTKSLIIPNVGVIDTGIYKCRASNIIQQSSIEANFSLVLKVVNGGSLQEPKFIIPPRNVYTVNAGETAFIECSAYGTPVPKISWHKFKGQLPANRTEMSPGGLHIYNITAADDGVYICSFKNLAGTVSFHITLMYNEAPTILDGPTTTDIKEGENMELECTVKGTPEPKISWILNGQSVLNDTSVKVLDNRIDFHPIEKKHAGIIQCFATNAVGTMYSSANVKVIPKQISSADVFEEYTTPQPPALPHKRRKHKKKLKGHRGTAEMIPPSKPTISRLNDESVVVRWSVPVNNGLPIQFFKVQYRELGPSNQNGTQGRLKNSRWKTTNADIAPHIRSYEVNNLKPDHYYRFRIAAVYSNNDNKLGPNSARFHLNRADFFLRNPLPVPNLTHTESVNATSIRIYWEYNPLQNASVDGFFVNYISASNAGDYMRASVEGEHVRSFIITHLQPDTVYDIKLQSFTTKSASEFSPILKQKTERSVTDLPVAPSSPKPGPSTSTQNNPSQLYIFIGAGVVGLALLLCVAILFIVCRKKQKGAGKSRDDGHGDKANVEDVGHHIQADANDYVVAPKSRVNGMPPSRITITANPLAEADNKNQNMIEMSCLSTQNNNCSVAQPSVSGQESRPSDSLAKIKNRDKRHKLNVGASPGENFV